MKTDRDVKVQALRDWFEHYNKPGDIRTAKRKRDEEMIAKVKLSIGMSLVLGGLSTLLSRNRSQKVRAYGYLGMGVLLVTGGVVLLVEDE